MIILGIESSCDETAAAVVRDGREILSSVISTQIAIHTEFGGVVPEIASRKHIENINTVIRQAVREANAALGGVPADAEGPELFSNIDAIGVTYGPGLVGALLVGVAQAKAMAYALKKPLIPVNHITGHVSANYLEHSDLKPPFLCLIVSGGHTTIVEVRDYGEYRIIASTRDDAAGEAFDKVARSVGLGYPGGPKIDKEAKNGNPEAIAFPRAKVHDAPYDFSFSGLKSAVLNFQNHAAMTGAQYDRADLVASFQKSVVDVLVEHTLEAAKEFGYREIALAGGVSANSALRAAMQAACDEKGYSLYLPSPVLCTDNGAMIGSAAFYEYRKGHTAAWDLNAVPSLQL